LTGIRKVTGTRRARYHPVRRFLAFVLRWTFIVIGAVAASSVLFTYLYHVNETIYDPSLFAIGVGGLFCMACGVVLMMLSRNSRLRMQLQRAKTRCEELADHAWELKEAEARASSLLEAQGDLIVRRDSAGRITYANDAYCALAGAQREALIGATATLPRLQEAPANVLPDGTRIHDEQVVTADGPRWLAWRDVVVWAPDHNSAEVQSVGRDVTERIETEHALAEARDAAEDASRAKSRFLAMVSHEIRTPLNGILGMADLLRDTALSREQADMLQTLRGSSRVMLGLVDEVLDFSKIEAGKLLIEKTDFDLHALVNSTCRIVSAQAAAKGIEFVVSIMPEVPPAVRGDPHHLRQVLINLAGNAVKFTEKGSVTVHASVQAETESAVRLKFSIRDTGIGIAPEAQAKIFESFAQADDSTTRRFGGTGLGTTIAKQLVGLMGGRIGLESAPGLGSTFWVEVDLDKQPERAGGGALSGELSGARVLLVGFPLPERSALEEALAGWGASAIAVATLEEGVTRMVSEISLARPYHSALLYATGEDTQLAQRFRRAAPNPAPPTILAVPRAADVRRFEMLSSGFAALLELPFEKRRLFNVLHSVAADEEVREGVVRLQDYVRRGSPDAQVRILVADDNPTNREVIGRILERSGHAVTLVNDGEQALDAIERGAHDLVILDRNMPGMGGVEALKALRLMLRGRAHLPVIMLSADVTPEAKREAVEAGADAFLSKPIETTRLLEEIRSLAPGRAEAARKPEAPASLHCLPPAVPAVINAETLQYLEELGSSLAFIEKLIGVFIADSASLLARMEQVLAARDFQEFRSLVHAMKGSSASIGTDRLTRLCASLGGLTDAELRLQAPVLQRTLGEELANARSQLERHLQERRSSTG
jgi:two-component system, sensor histidine kinase RpfC